MSKKSSSKRATAISWDTDDDESLDEFIIKRRSKQPKVQGHQLVTRETRDKCHRCMSTFYSMEDGKTVFKNLSVSDDAIPEKMLERKWALAQGKFKILTKSGAEDLEETTEFQTAVRAGRPRGPVRYSLVPRGYSENELLMSSKPCIVSRNTRYSFIKATFPGCGNRHHIVWTTRSGDIMIDRGVKLYEISSVQCHQIEVDCRGPKSPWFALVDPAVIETFDGRIHFDANLFWTVGLLYKHFDTTGIESWDAQLDEMRSKARQISFSKPPPSVQMLRSSQPPAIPYPVFYKYPPIPICPPQQVLEPLPIVQLPTVPITSTPIHLPDPSAPPAIHIPPPLPQVPTEPVNNQRYTGCITDWKTTFGFITCDHIPGLIFLHSNDILNLDEQLQIPNGASINFSLKHDPVKGFKAFNAKLFL